MALPSARPRKRVGVVPAGDSTLALVVPMELGNHRLDLEAQVLRNCDGAVVPLRPQAWAVLCVLAANAGRLVTKEEMLDNVWPGRVVTDGSLAQAVRDVRAALGPTGRDLVKTVARRGYMMLVPTARSIPIDRSESDSAVVTDAMVGRGEALDAVLKLLGRRRLVTVLGPGGMGKTRLAQAAVPEMSPLGPDGVFWVDLTPLTDARDIVPAIAAVTRLSHVNDGVDSFVRACGALHALLVLDNCEHLVEAVAGLANDLLAAGARLRLLVTSQAPLRINGEQIYRLAPLAVPEVGLSPQQALEYGAVALFVRQATACDSRFRVDEQGIVEIVNLCRQLDGNPLAIKLAAARAPVLGLHMLGVRIEQRLQMLVGGGRDAPTRQRSLAATLGWSYSLLDAEERRVFRALGVFAGGFTIESAVAVAGQGDHLEWPLIDIVTRLVDRSLIDVDSQGRTRLRMSESARAFALEQLRASDESASVAHRHALACVAQFARLANDLYSGRISQRAYVATQRLEVDNLRTAIRWLLGPEGDRLLALSLLGDAAPFGDGLAIQVEAVEWLTELGHALEAHGGASARDAARYRFAAIHWTFSWTGASPPRTAGSDLPHMQAPLDALEDSARRGHALCVLAKELSFGRNRVAARAALDEAAALESPQWPVWLRLVRLNSRALLEIFVSPREVERDLTHALVALVPGAEPEEREALTLRFYLALNIWLQGRFDEAAERFEAVVRSGRSQQHDHLMCWAFIYLAIARAEQGRFDDARASTLDGLPVLRRAGVLGLAANGLALLAAKLGSLELAAKLFGASEAFLTRTGWRHNKIGDQVVAQVRAILNSDPRRAAIEEWVNEGSHFDDEAIVRAVQLEMRLNVPS